MFVVKTDRYRMLKDDIKITDGTSKMLYGKTETRQKLTRFQTW